MARPIRHWEPGRLYFVTQRTIHGRLLLHPSPEIRDLVGGILAKAANMYCVMLYGWVILGNHLHLTVSHPLDGRIISDFMCFVSSNIARKVGRLVGWREKFWGRRFSAEPILDDDAAVARLHYMLMHGAKEGLVDSPRDWPGLTCIPELVDGANRDFVWENWTMMFWRRAMKAGAELTPEERARCQERHTLVATRLPCFEQLPEDEYRKTMADLLAKAEASARELRGDKPVLGVAGVLAQNPHDTPETLCRSPRPLCHASTEQTHNEFEKGWRALVDAYCEASAAFRSGVLTTVFPVGTFRPWLRDPLVVPG